MTKSNKQYKISTKALRSGNSSLIIDIKKDSKVKYVWLDTPKGLLCINIEHNIINTYGHKTLTIGHSKKRKTPTIKTF